MNAYRIAIQIYVTCPAIARRHFGVLLSLLLGLVTPEEATTILRASGGPALRITERT